MTTNIGSAIYKQFSGHHASGTASSAIAGLNLRTDKATGITNFSINLGAEGEIAGTATPTADGGVAFSHVTMLWTAADGSTPDAPGDNEPDNDADNVNLLLGNLEKAIAKYAIQPSMANAAKDVGDIFSKAMALFQGLTTDSDASAQLSPMIETVNISV